MAVRRASEFLIILGAVWASVARTAAQDNSDCFECHGRADLKTERDGREVSLHVDAERFAKSVHADLDCITCHEDLDGVEEFPHPANLKRVNCGECHEDDDGPIAAFWASTHGQHLQAGDPDAPRCQDCHGDHYILPLSDPNSSISPFNIPGMCAQCHEEGAEVARTHDIPQDQIFKRYRQSIHGEGLFKQGLISTAVCTSCHTGHNVLPHTDPRSTIHKDRIQETCMQCHGLIEQVHRKIIAGELWRREGVVPVCVECHQPHEARKVFYDSTMRNADCLRCHGDRTLEASDNGRPLYVDGDEHAGSVHGRNSITCVQCHTGVQLFADERPCHSITEPVNCASCHEDAAAAYNRGRHGQLHQAGDRNAPYCTECHGSHNTLEHEVPEGASSLLARIIRESPTYSRNVPALCGRCHREGGQAVARPESTEEGIVRHYSMSIHGKGLLESGLSVTATCTDCHSAHMALSSDDPDSTVHSDNIASTCGNCHDGIYELYEQSVHSSKGNPDYADRREGDMPELPNCDDCHSAHAVARTDLPEFKQGIVEQCGTCHKDAIDTYFDTYHGKATELGDTTRANCYDCHDAHAIFRMSDPRSTLHRDNVVATCGKCHPGSHRRFAGYLSHATHHDPHKYPALYYAFWFMTTLLVGTLGFFGLHTLAWLPRSWKLRKAHAAELAVADPNAKQFLRFTSFERKLHFTVIVSFFGLAITGMTLKFSYAGWAQWLTQLLGGTNGTGWIHRICAIVTFGYFLVHLIDVGRRFSSSPKTLRQFLFDQDTILPTFRDVREFFGTLKWFLRLGPRPHYGAWTYWEKFDYFAVFWGIAVIGSTGLCLWFPETFTLLIPGWWINVATLVHSDEALLATGFIFTIHFFNTHFRPDKFPMDPVIFTGRMSVEELKRDKPRLYEELVESGDLKRRLVRPESRRFIRLATLFAYSALFVGLALIALIIYAMVFAYR